MSDVAKTIWLSLFVVFAIAIAREAWGQDGSHGNGHSEMHDTYKDWRIPTNPLASCCHDEDCRPTRAYVDQDGWHAWNGERWLSVPDAALLPQDLAKDGRNHICEKGGYVYCFSPTGPKS